MPRAANLPPLNRAERRAAAQASAARNDGRPLLTVEGAAEYLNKSKYAVYRIIRSKKLRTFQVEGTLRIRPSDLDAYLDDNVAS
jgi:excisionase family DNA binding protein